MASSRFAFSALLKKVNPPSDRAAVAQRLPGEVREWLKEHEFPTVAPHTRLIGSHGRKTAITNIKDVDTQLTPRSRSGPQLRSLIQRVGRTMNYGPGPSGHHSGEH